MAAMFSQVGSRIGNISRNVYGEVSSKTFPVSADILIVLQKFDYRFTMLLVWSLDSTLLMVPVSFPYTWTLTTMSHPLVSRCSIVSGT